MRILSGVNKPLIRKRDGLWRVDMLAITAGHFYSTFESALVGAGMLIERFKAEFQVTD